MYPANRKFIFYVFLLCAALQAFYHKAIASATLTAAQWQRITSDSAFAYRNDLETAHPPVKTDNRFLEKFLTAISGFLTNGVGRILLWCIVAAMAIFIVYKLLFSDDSIFFSRGGKSTKKKQIDIAEQENIAATDWESLMQNAVLDNDQRLAVRYSYMWLLQLLQKGGRIIYSNDKTNFDYYNELGNSEYRQPFRQLSRQYEYVWYGQYALTPDQYEQYNTLFNTLKTQLNK